MTRYLGARSGRARQSHRIDPLPPRKEDAPCCQARALPDGRPPIGFCSPECIRRPGNWLQHVVDVIVGPVDA